MKKLKPSEILKCMDFCGNALTCTTDNHACAYGDEGCIDCVDRLEADIQALIDVGDNLILRPSPENKPLTVDELRTMTVDMGNRSWVWIEVLEPFDCELKTSAYYQVQMDYTQGEAFVCGYPGVSFGFDYADYGKTWLAYARKPEKEEKE